VKSKYISKISIGQVETLYPLATIFKGARPMSYGIALAGGGCRGAAHVGVLLALEENNMLPSSIAGASAGGIVAGLYASGFSIQKMKELILDPTQTGYHLLDADLWGMAKAFCQMAMHRPVTFTGLVKGNALEKMFYDLTGGCHIREAKMRVVIPAVDLNSGRTIAYTNSLHDLSHLEQVRWRNDVLLCEAMRASSAYPSFFQPKKIGKMCLVDGGLTHNLPVDLLIAGGEKKVLAVDIGEAYQKMEQENVVEIVSHSLNIMRIRLLECSASGEELTVQPDLPPGAGLLTFNLMGECMEAGYRATIKMLPLIKNTFF